MNTSGGDKMVLPFKFLTYKPSNPMFCHYTFDIITTRVLQGKWTSMDSRRAEVPLFKSSPIHKLKTEKSTSSNYEVSRICRAETKRDDKNWKKIPFGENTFISQKIRFVRNKRNQFHWMQVSRKDLSHQHKIRLTWPQFFVPTKKQLSPNGWCLGTLSYSFPNRKISLDSWFRIIGVLICIIIEKA